jgi:hypothetical protein
MAAGYAHAASRFGVRGVGVLRTVSFAPLLVETFISTRTKAAGTTRREMVA